MKEKFNKILNIFKDISIKWKIFIFLIGFCAILVSVLWLFQIVFLDNFYKFIKISETKNAAEHIVSHIDNENIEAYINEVSLDNDVCIEIISESNGVIFSSNVLKECTIHKMTYNDKQRLFNNTIRNGGDLLQVFQKQNIHFELNMNRQNLEYSKKPRTVLEESIVYTKIVSNYDGEKILVIINAVVSPVNATVNTLLIQIYYITGIMIVLSVILALIIAKRVSNPIEKINESAKLLATGKYDVDFTVEGYKEIKELSNTLNFAASELSKVENLRRELIANISHDLRTPLTLISGYAQAMRDLPNENNIENLQIIIDETNRLSSLVNDVLDISKINSGTLNMNSEKYNLTNEIKCMIENINSLVEKDGYNIIFNYDQEVIVSADKSKISQALYNIIINAINYTGDDKKVIIKQVVSDDKVKIDITDSGEGISQEDLPYIWERYYKVDKVHKRGITGSGIGLSIVKSIIELHNGKYGVESELGKGSTFWISLNI